MTLLLQPISPSPTVRTSIMTYFIVVDAVVGRARDRDKRQLANSTR